MENFVRAYWVVTFGRNGFTVSNKRYPRKIHFMDDSIESVGVEYGDVQWNLGNTLELFHEDLIPKIRHGDFKSVETKPKNVVEVMASCGQKTTLNLDNIDENQPISEVTVRGVKYIPKNLQSSSRTAKKGGKT